MQKRNQSLDALRGLAILAMVLSGSIAFGGVLPAWMYHAQVPPPDHRFHPEVAGITWVDLVFPFFLFSMGAAIPLSLQKNGGAQKGFLPVCWVAVRRFVLLTFFALFTFHLRAWVLSSSPTAADYALSLFAFVLLFFQFYEAKEGKGAGLIRLLKGGAFAAAVALLWLLPFGGKGFQWQRSDIIILVLGNMAFFGTLAWWLTRHHPWLRAGLLPFVGAVFAGAQEAGSWNNAVFDFSPMPWMYTFYYLKYLFIIIPGTFAGEWLLESSRAGKDEVADRSDRRSELLVAGVAAVLIVVNVALLFGRHLVANLFITGALSALLYYLVKRVPGPILLVRFCTAGIYLLLLGLAFEACQGGIRKDPSTYSYYLVTSGLAFLLLLVFYGWSFGRLGRGIIHYLSLNGRNPMVAYVAGSLVVLPLLHLTALHPYFDALNTNAWLGVLKGVLFTGVVSLITIFFTRRGWYWKT